MAFSQERGKVHWNHDFRRTEGLKSLKGSSTSSQGASCFVVPFGPFNYYIICTVSN